MLKRRSTAGAALLLLVALACGDDGGTGTDGDNLVGTWVATSALFTSVAEPAVTADPVEDGDVSLTLVVRADGTITITTLQGGVAEVDDGTIDVTGSMVAIDLAGDTTSGTIDLDDDRLELLLTSNTSFDFGSGEEAATLRLVFVRA